MEIQGAGIDPLSRFQERAKNYIMHVFEIRPDDPDLIPRAEVAAGFIAHAYAESLELKAAADPKATMAEQVEAIRAVPVPWASLEEYQEAARAVEEAEALKV